MLSTHRQLLPIVIVGHVDHGKSTLIGRLLYDTDSLPAGKHAELQKMAARRGLEDIEWSFVLDAFQAERDQNVTIDTTQIRFKTGKRDYVIIDAPGHREFLKNMVSGAAAAAAAFLVIDAVEGVKEQTKRHAYLLHLLGLKQVAVIVNKMDLAGHDPEKFNQVKTQIETYLSSLGIVPTHVIPVSARTGAMVAGRGDKLDWYAGLTVMETLDGFEIHPPSVALPLRFPVQDVYKFGDERVIVGRVESGTLKKGDTLVFSPSGSKAVVTALRVWPDDAHKTEAHAGEVVGVTLDQPVFVERGQIASHEINMPALSNIFRVRLFWLSPEPLKVGNSYTIRYATHEAPVTVQSIDSVIDTQTLARDSVAVDVPSGAVAEITLRARNLLPIDSYDVYDRTGRVVLYHGHDLAGGGTISMEGYADQRRLTQPKATNIHAVHHLVSYEDRIMRTGHKGCVFWLTGFSGAGKSTLAMLLEKELFARGRRVYVLDGDNVRRRLCADLGFSPEDRSENIRRVGEVAALMAEAGLIVITAFISPFHEDRERARRAAGERFHEIYIKADLSVCEKRDPKGLYRKARAGEIADFTGIDSPYEVPENPDLVIDTARADIDACLSQILSYIENHSALTPPEETSRAF